MTGRREGAPDLVSRVLLAVCVVAWAGCATGIRGSVSEGRYTSPQGLFTATIPTATNWVGLKFEILDFTGSGESSFDMAGFYVKEFGEARVASVTRIPPAALDTIAKADPKKLLRDVADKALWDWRRKFPEAPLVAEEEFISTPDRSRALR